MASLALPAFDGTLGALFTGTIISTVLYGVTCVQTFMYATSTRTKRDILPFKAFVYTLFLLDTGHQVSNSMGMYRFLITDYVNPFLLIGTKNSQGAFYIHLEAIFSALLIVMVQLFYAWRVWAFSFTVSNPIRWLFTLLIVSLALLTFAAGLIIFVRTLPNVHSGPSVFTPSAMDILDWKIELPGAIACDLVITIAMLLNLFRSRTGISRSDGVLNFLVVFTINTGLLTVVLSTASLISFLVLPTSNLAYVAMETVLPKLYLNSLLATLNAREYLKEKMNPDIPLSMVGAISRIKFATNPSTSQMRDTENSESKAESRVGKKGHIAPIDSFV